MKHPERVINSETPFETGERLTYMRYDAVEKVIAGMNKGFVDQAVHDGKLNHPQLSDLNTKAAEKAEELKEIVARMWEISEPHMPKEGE